MDVSAAVTCVGIQWDTVRCFLKGKPAVDFTKLQFASRPGQHRRHELLGFIRVEFGGAFRGFRRRRRRRDPVARKRRRVVQGKVSSYYSCISHRTQVLREAAFIATIEPRL